MRQLFALLLSLCTAFPAYGWDVNGELKKAQLEKLSSDPTGTEARVYYNTTDDVIKVYDGGSWLTIADTTSTLSNPMTADRDLIVGGSSGTPTRLDTTRLGDITALSTGSSTVTITIATPGVVSFTGHGLTTGRKVYLTTTGALPTGLTASTTYYVVVVDANSFSLATSLANAVAGTKIATSGSQSGTHTLFYGGLALTSGVKGTTTDDNATAGYVGEYKESTFSAVSVASSTQRSDLTTLTLTAGDWDVEGVALVSRNGASYSTALYILSIITASGNSATGEVDGQNLKQESSSIPTTNNGFTMNTPRVRVKSDGTNLTIAGTTTAGQIVRLKYYPGTYSTATPTASGILRARRVR